MYISLYTFALTEIGKMNIFIEGMKKKRQSQFLNPYEGQIYLIGCGIRRQHTQHDNVAWLLVELKICSIVLVLPRF